MAADPELVLHEQIEPKIETTPRCLRRVFQFAIVGIQQIERLAVELGQQPLRGFPAHGFQSGHGRWAQIVIMSSALDERGRPLGQNIRGGGGQVVMQISAEIKQLLRAAGPGHERRGVEDDMVGGVHRDDVVVQPVVQDRAWPHV